MTSDPLPRTEMVLYQTEDGRTRVQCRFEDETIWLTQAQIAELFQVAVPTVNEHLKGIWAEGELAPGATIRKFRIVRLEGSREVARDLEHYRLEAILAIGYRVRSHRGTQFRQWATARLTEYLVKGFAMDDERLKNPPGKGQKDYFDPPFRGPDVADPLQLLTAEQAKAKAELEYDRYRVLIDSQPRPVDADFEQAVTDLKKLPAAKARRRRKAAKS
jgi:hypothetical protein